MINIEEIIKTCSKSGDFAQRGVYSDKFMWSKLDYIHMNPVRAGIVEKASHYTYSSAGFYVNKKGLLKVEVMPNPVVDVLKTESILKYDKY